MALDTNIALGIRPVEQPNMLAQMGQMMALRGAQQEYEGTNALRDAYAQGGDLNDPAFRRRVMSANPKLGSQLISQHSETSARDIKTQADSLKTIKDNIGLANNPQAMAEYLRGAYGTPGGALLAKLVPLDKALASIPNDPKAFADFQRNFGLTTDKLFTSAADQLQAQVTREGHGVTMRGQDLVDARSRETHAREQANYPLHFFTAPDGTLMSTSTRAGSAGASAVPMAGSNTPPPQVTIGAGGSGGGARGGAGSSIMVNPSSINNLAPVNQNALITQPQPTFAPAAPAYAQVRSTPVTKDIVDPTDPTGRRMITVEVNNYKAGTGLGADGKQAAPAGVLGVATSQIPPNYMRDPKNPDGLIPVPGSAADPRAAVPSGYQPKADGNGFEPIPGGPADPKTTAPSGYRRTADGNLEFIPGSAADPSTVVPPNYRRAANGKDLEFIPGGPADPKVIAAQNRIKLSEKDAAAREASYPRATSALKSFDAKTDKFDRDITELLTNEKGLNEITGFFSGRTDLSAMSKEARRALALFNTITAKGGFSELQDMRNASPTGGALGNVSNQEGKQLIDSFAALSRTQNANDVRKSLETARSDLQNLKQRMREAYDLTYEYRGAGGGAPALPPGFKAD